MHLTPKGFVKNRFKVLEYLRVYSVFESVLCRALGRDLLFLRWVLRIIPSRFTGLDFIKRFLKLGGMRSAKRHCSLRGNHCLTFFPLLP